MATHSLCHKVCTLRRSATQFLDQNVMKSEASVICLKIHPLSCIKPASILIRTVVI